MRTVLYLALLLGWTTVAFSQPAFEVPLRTTDGVAAETLYFGVFPGAHLCLNTADCFNGHCEEFLPPIPPGVVFDARFVAPRYSPIPTYDQGSPADFRPYPPYFPTGRDTFKVRAQTGTGTTMTFSWPASIDTCFAGLFLKYFDWVAEANVIVDMLTTTSVNVTNGLGYPNNSLVVTIWSTGVVVGVLPTSNETIPLDAKLYANYPNPFNPTTTIRYALPCQSINSAQGRAGVGSHVALKVFDVLGREVATLVEGNQVPGEHTVEWRPENIPSGVYIYRLTTSHATVARKMLLLR